MFWIQAKFVYWTLTCRYETYQIIIKNYKGIMIDCVLIKIQKEEISGAPNDVFLSNALKTLFQTIQSTLRPLQMHSKQPYKIYLYLFGHPRGTYLNKSFRNCKGFSIIFPKMLNAIQRIYESEKNFDSSLHFHRKIFRFPFSYEKQPGLGCEM